MLVIRRCPSHRAEGEEPGRSQTNRRPNHLDDIERLDLTGVELDDKVKAALRERFADRVVLD
jgi:hypothetical protein